MYIQRNTKRVKDKVYHSVLLRNSYRKNGKNKHKTISNLSSWPEELINQFEKLLKTGKVTKLEDLTYKQGKAYGAIKVIHEIAKILGIKKALGNSKQSLLCLMMIAGRILTGGSRLHLCNWAKDEAIEEVFKISNFNENNLYNALDWLCDNQKKIENKLFKLRKSTKIKEVFLYDVTSSYLEGEHNELANWGYNRDKKSGKKQIVIGFLTDENGVPISVEVFKGNTQDPKTVLSQLKKLSEQFGVERVVFVGDRGMIKSGQIEEINEMKYNYITAITRPQIQKLITDDILQLGLFDKNLCEVEYNNIRYILRKNPIRKKEIEENRNEKIKHIIEKIKKKNQYLLEHPKASVECGIKEINKFIGKLKIKGIVELKSVYRKIIYDINKKILKEKSLLDGCYAIKTDIPSNLIKKEIIHSRYKKLSEVEKAFRTMKTGLLEIRPLFLRKESRTRGHIFICMLSYMITKHIWDKLKHLNIQQELIFRTLDRIQYISHTFENKNIKILPNEYSEIQSNILRQLKIKLAHQL